MKKKKKRTNQPILYGYSILSLFNMIINDL